MATYVPPKYATEYITYIGLTSQADANVLQSNPTIAAGDFKVSKDGGALANLTTLPAVTPAASKMVKITLSSTEMTADNVTVVCSDAAGAEWRDQLINLQTVLHQVDEVYAIVDEIGAGGALLTAIPWNPAWDVEVQSEVADALEVTIADSIPADGTRPSVKQALLMLTRFLWEKAVSGTTVTVKKEDGSTTAFTATLDSSTDPTSITRAS